MRWWDFQLLQSVSWYFHWQLSIYPSGTSWVHQLASKKHLQNKSQLQRSNNYYYCMITNFPGLKVNFPNNKLVKRNMQSHLKRRKVPSEVTRIPNILNFRKKTQRNNKQNSYWLMWNLDQTLETAQHPLLKLDAQEYKASLFLSIFFWVHHLYKGQTSSTL